MGSLCTGVLSTVGSSVASKNQKSTAVPPDSNTAPTVKPPERSFDSFFGKIYSGVRTPDQKCNSPGEASDGGGCSELTIDTNEPEGKERSCDTLLMCIVTAVNQGVRNGGGLGDVLRYPSSKEPLYAARVVYDLLYFFVVIIIVLNLIFGVIIDTFADLRSEKTTKEEILKNTCFICGMCIFGRRIGFMVLWLSACHSDLIGKCVAVLFSHPNMKLI